MSEPTLCKYLSEVVIVAGSNDSVRINDGSWFTATIAEGSYFITGDDEATDLLKAIKTAFDAVGTGTWTIALSSSNKVQFTCNTSGAVWAIDMDNAATTFDFEILGAADISAAFGAADNVADTLDYQHRHGWYSTQTIESDTDELGEIDAAQNRSKGSKISTVKLGSDHVVRAISHAYEPYRKAFAQSGYENQSWSAFWVTCNSGEAVRYYPDVDTDDDYFTGVLRGDALAKMNPARYNAGVAVYNWIVDFYKYI